MERRVVDGKGYKRKPEDEDRDTVTFYRFKVLLLPVGVSVELRVMGPVSEMTVDEFVELVRDEYFRAPKQLECKRKRSVNWSGGRLYLEDANDNKIRHKINFLNFKPYKCHILRLHDGGPEVTDAYENMWDLTPDTELLRELPEEYTFETALADLIDNSLQAVWSNKKGDRRLISVQIMKNKISIFDTGPGMDGSDENSIAKWGKMGASLNRLSKARAIGVKPPYLMPFFGMFGYGGPIATMHLGRRALVSSKTEQSRKVYVLHLKRDDLLNNSSSDLTWKTNGGIRDPSDDEVEKSPHGSFTEVEILELKIKRLEIFQLQCKLKDIYFPYIQCDEASNGGKTTRPVEFQVNDVNLAEIEGGEVSVTNLHSCNGPDFIFNLHFVKQDNSPARSPGLRISQEANARLKCVYFPAIKGKESIEMILEKLEAEGCEINENIESFSRISVRRLGRLLPDARWSYLPFMDFKQRRGDKAYILKRCCLRVKCFIETDAGFNPTPSKTDLAHHNPFTASLKNFGYKTIEKEKDVSVEIYQDGKYVTPLQLDKEYQDWILHMHALYDEEIDSGVDEPVLIVGPTNKKALGISSDVVRVHRMFDRKGSSWKSGQKIKVLKGACPGIYKNNVYATLEYFLIEGFQGDAGGEARIICRPISVAGNSGCVLDVNNKNASLDIRDSLSLPITAIDSGKCQVMDISEWNYQLEKLHQKSPSIIDLPCALHCHELEIDGILPTLDTISAGNMFPMEIVAVVRPANYSSTSTFKNLEQKHILKTDSVMSMQIKCKHKCHESVDHIYSACVAPSSCKGIDGLYIFKLGCRTIDLFQSSGVYTFLFSLTDSSCKNYEKSIEVMPSLEVAKLKILEHKQLQPYIVRVGSSLPPIRIGCFDMFDNQIPFTSVPEVTVKFNTLIGVLSHVEKVKTFLSSDKMTLEIKDFLFESSELDEIRPDYNSTLVICSIDESFSISVPCQVTPGSVQQVRVHPPIQEKHLRPGFLVKKLVLEMFDAYGNHVAKGAEVQLNVHGFAITDEIGSKRKVDDHGYIDLSGLLQVTACNGSAVSISVSSEDKVILKQEFRTEKRELRVALGVQEFCFAGSRLENVIFEVVNSDGNVDETIHDEEKCGQSHTLLIKSDMFKTVDSIQSYFRKGRCTIQAIPLPSIEGKFRFRAAHSCYSELHVSVEVTILPAPEVECDEIQSPFSNGKVLLLQDSSSHKQVENHMMSIVNTEKQFELDICRVGEKIACFEMKQMVLKSREEEIEQAMAQLEASVDPCFAEFLCNAFSKEKIKEHIEGRNCSAASIICHTSKDHSSQEPYKCFIKDIVGLVALLGTVSTNRLSRILAEFLGEEKMLAVVCKSNKTTGALEKYNENGEVDSTLGLYEEAAVLGKSICGRFHVICLEDIRPYNGELEGSDPQRKLSLLEPLLPNGNIAPGFVGYAVNLVNLDNLHVHTETTTGHGLRETLFYRLFGKLQVYETRKHMINARACIKHGAVSLDGGILRANGIISLGCGNPEICFPVTALDNEMHLSPEMVEMKKKYEEYEEELRATRGELEKVSRRLEKFTGKFRKKSEKYKTFLDQIEPVLKQMHASNIKS